MSLLDKQEVHEDICEHTALRARKWSGFIVKQASEDTVAVKKTFPKLFTVHRSCSIGMVNDVNDE